MNYFLKVLEQTGFQLLLFMVPSLVLAAIMQLITTSLERSVQDTMGTKFYLAVFGWLGVVVHELGHALFCLIFRHKITELKLFKPDPTHGTLGYVKHSYNPANFYQKCGNFFIGVGPIILGSLVIFISAKLLMGSTITFSPVVQTDGILNSLKIAFDGAFNSLISLFNFDALKRWQTYLFIYISFSVGSKITLSKADILGAISGLISLTVVIFFTNLVTLGFSDLGNSLYNLFGSFSY
ncbi:MAG: hypothetical protein KAG98_06370 [Lentisphaeria bacterium]|nr:hypothetical protein [Lentisphaeria bacterium]